jgi:uncharacterized protein YlaI
MNVSDKTKFVQSLIDMNSNHQDDSDIVEQPTSDLNNTPNNNSSETLECSHCHKVQPISEFYVTTNYFHEKRGRTYRCKTCSRQSARESLAKKKAMKVTDVLN